MAQKHHQPNKLVNREKAEILQEKLFAAATTALDLAMAEEKIPGNLLSACQSILRDSAGTDLAETIHIQMRENSRSG